MPLRLQQGSYNVHADKRDGVEGHDLGGEAKQEKCVVYDGQAILAPNLLRNLCCNRLIPRTNGVPHEGIYEIMPQGGIRCTARRGTRQLAAGFYRENALTQQLSA